MGIRIGNPRVGHRVGGFYVSGPVTGRNAGRQFRVGHRLPGGFYGSVPVTVTATRSHPGRSLAAGVLSTVVTSALFGWLAVSTGSWILLGSLATAVGLYWLWWAKNRSQ